MPSHDNHDHHAREAEPFSPSTSVARGRHRAPQLTADTSGLPAEGGRYSTWSAGWSPTRRRTTLAAVTTGTLAVGGVALAGCAPATHDSTPDMSGINPATAPLTVSGAMAQQVGLLATSASTQHTAQLAALSVDVPPVTHTTGLLIGPGHQVAKPLAPTKMKILLLDQQTHKGISNAHLRVMRKINNVKWATTSIVVTDNQGYASYTAKVLTTTKLTVVFDGTSTEGASHGNINTIDMYRAPAPKPVVAPQTALTVTPAQSSTGGGLQVTAPSTGTTQASAPVGSGLGSKAVWLASQQAGKPYVYGGDGPYSFDCSGLVQYVYRQLGVSLPRTAEAQYEATTHISQADAQPGDLIFIGSPGSVYHVGIYAGNGQFWNAPNSGQSVSLMTIWDSNYLVGRV